jgi:hypothetical protein
MVAAAFSRGSDVAPATSTTSVAMTGAPSAAPPAATTMTAATTPGLPQPTRDLSERPQIWFGPLPPLGANEFGEIRTGPEFYGFLRTAGCHQAAVEPPFPR